MSDAPSATPQALAGLKVIDLSTLFAGPLAAMMLGDFGADVIKIEHPQGGDGVRRHGHSKDGVPLWWKMVGRNKKSVTLYLGAPEGAALFRRLTADADVIVENFRPGTLERWGLGYDILAQDNPRLILARVTGFGQFGPYSARPGFGTLAEAMSGFAAVTGEPDGPPTLPPFGLADGIAAQATAFAVLAAVNHRHASGRGQVIDTSLIEPILSLLGPQAIVWDQLKIKQERSGNRSVNNAPRNTYRCSDGSWVAISTSAQSIAERVMHLVGRPELVAQPWFAEGKTRAEHADELDAAVGGWIAQRTRDEVVDAFEQAEAAVAPIYDVEDIFADPQYRALGSLISVPDEDLGQVTMQNVMFRMSETPGAIRWAGPRLGQHNREILGALGVGDDEFAELVAKGVTSDPA